MKKLILISIFFSFTSCNVQNKEESGIINVEVEEFKQLIENNNNQLIDVRTLNEYKNGHIKKAKLVDFFDQNFKEEIVQGLNKNEPIYVYCRSGFKSAKAAKIFKEVGFKKIYNLLGGINAWRNNNLEIEK